jgi:hypothetical protein
MQLVKLITPKRIKVLQSLPFGRSIPYVVFVVLFFGAFCPAYTQDNSPYSRYGIGDIVPPTHILNRGMGGISAGYTDRFSINFNNPASYSAFQSIRETKNKKQILGRAILDLGINFDNRTLREPKPSVAQKFVAKNALFSYLQVGVALKNNWGLSFGLRPVSRISYKLIRNERLTDPVTGLPIDSASTRFEGTGGAFLPTIGTGFSIIDRVTKNGPLKLSVGLNFGYMFGSTDYSVKRSLINDTVNYYQANYETKTTFGKSFFNGGLQFKIPINKKISLTFGAYGNLNDKLSASKDALRETFRFDAVNGDVRLDSVSDEKNIKGKIVYPASYTIGFVLEKEFALKEPGWLFGVDFSRQNWDNYRFYGQSDSVRSNWELRVGTQLRPAPKKNYFSNVSYRLGFFTGPDYIRVQNKLSHYGISFGLGLPIANSRSSYVSINQYTLINLAFEYGKRGNNDNLLKESLFRFSLGFSLSDLWFSKRKYE